MPGFAEFPVDQKVLVSPGRTQVAGNPSNAEVTKVPKIPVDPQMPKVAEISKIPTIPEAPKIVEAQEVVQDFSAGTK